MSGFVHTPMTLPPVAFGTDPTGDIAVQILGGGGGGGGGGATTIIALLDTPGAYGTAGQVLAVNSGRTGMEFVDQAGSGFDGAFASLTGLPTTLAGYGITDAAPISHTQSMASITGLSAQLTALSDAIDTKAAASHTHAIGDTTGLQAALDGKSPAGHTHAFSALTGLPTTLAGYGITDAAAASHVHSIAQITGLSGQLTALSDAIDTKAAASHTHAFSALTGIPTTLAGYGITDAANISHTHAFSALTGIPTTLAGYGITDAAPISHTHTRTDGYIGHVEAPTARTYYIELACPVGRTITRIDAITSAGTVDLTLKNGAATVWTADGIDSSGVSITSGLANTSLALNGTLSLVVDAVSSGADLRFAVRFTETVPAP